MAIEVNNRKRKHKNISKDDQEADEEVPMKVAKKSKSPKKPRKKQEGTAEEKENGLDIEEVYTEIQEDDQEADEEVPMKVAKKSKSPKKPKKKQEGTGEEKENGLDKEEVYPEIHEEAEGEEGEDLNGSRLEDSNQDSDFVEKEMKFSKDFKMLNFRAKLRGNNFITELRHLLYLTKSRPKMIAKYIEKRGKPLELAEALERIDKSNVLHVAYLCEALQLVIMEILTEQKSHMESAVHACRYFLKAHGPVLDSLLGSTNFQHRRVALKLLTAIVCVEPQLGRQLLSSYDILSNVRTIENLFSHSKFEINEEDTVRKCFIHFVLAYLVDGNTLLIRNILDRGTLIRGLASGLQYDDHVTVCVVLSTLKKYVLECTDISKTKKVHVFDLECCKNFVRLYDWNGPQAFAVKFGGVKQIGKFRNDPLERETVSAAVHEFLLVLLTSRKYGISFDAMTHFKQKHNNVQGKVIGFLFKPWCNERKTDLVLKILQACPDVARNTMRHFNNIVNPLVTPLQVWPDCSDFLAKLITTMHPKLLKNALDKITLTDFSYWIKDICLPLEVLVHITGSNILRSPRYAVRLAVTRLLLAMFTQYANYISAITKREQTRGGNSLRRFKFDILNHLLVNFPTADNIMFALYLTIQDQHKEGVDVLEHLDVTLDLVLIICKESRSFIHKTAAILNYIQLLRPLYAADENPELDEASSEKHNHIKIELKAVKVLLLLYPKALNPSQNLFKSVLKSFIKAFVRGEDEVQREAGDLLHAIFKNTGIFDAGELEIDLWLQAIRFFDGETIEVVTNVLMEVLQVTKAKIDAPKAATSNTNEKNLQKLFENIEQGLSVQAYVETLSISKLMPLILKGVELVKPLDKYLETVCLLMFHYYPMPEFVLQLYEQEFTSLKRYMSSWLQGAEVDGRMLEGKIVENIPRLKDLQRVILEGGHKFEGFFAPTGDDALELEYNGKSQKLNAVLRNVRMILIYTQTIVFIVAQLVAKQKLQQSQAEQAASFLIRFIQIAQELEIKNAGEDDALKTQDVFLPKLLKYIFNTRVSYISSAEIFDGEHESNINYLRFLSELSESCHNLEDFAQHTANYRLKIVKAVAISLQQVDTTIQQTDKLADSLRLIKAFRLEGENCIEILDLIASKLKYTHFFNPATGQKTIYCDLLVLMLQRLAELQHSVKCDEFVRKFVKIYCNCVRKLNANVNLEQLEEVFTQFLLISHQYIPTLDAKFFDALFAERKITKSSVKLACLLLERDLKLKENFLSHLPTSIGKKELIYPLLKIAFRLQLEMDSALLNKLYQEYKNGFMKTIEKPQKAGVIYKENVESSLALIELCMPKSECVDFCNKNFKFDVIELYQMKIIQTIYKKAMASLEGESASKHRLNVFVNYINLNVQMLSVDLKRQSLDVNRLALFAFYLQQWISSAPAEFAAADFSKILQSQQWLNFCKSCLKLAMHVNENEDELQRIDEQNGLLLKVLAYLCDHLYANYSVESEEEEPQEPAQLFEMIFTHSKFFDIVLSQRTQTMVKTEVLHLLFVLAQKSPTQSLSEAQIPVILGAYQAKLYAADRYALALLQLYEKWDVGLQQYRPFIWGESAIAFYSLRAADEERTKLTQQETSIAQVMSLVDRQVCEYTIDNFPIWRKLNSVQQLPEVTFADPSRRALAFGTNALERRIELDERRPFEEVELRLCPKREAVYEQCYDPAFFIPLMNLCFAPESYSHPARPVQNGLLSVVFAALSSQDKEMRLAAGCVQLRYRAHFEASKFFERPLWIQAYDNIQSGLSELRDSWMKHKKNSGTPRVPFIAGLFVAKAFNLTTDPTHLLYKQLTMYLRLKSSFNFQCVPEFNVLFYSPEVEHHQFRQFIVEVIRNGIKSSSDLFLLVTTHTFKVLMGFYGSTMSTLDLNLLILSVFSTCVKIPASTKIMIENVGLLPWLASIVGSLEFYHFDIIEGLISILNNLWYALKANASEFHNFQHICADIHRLLVLLLPHLSPRISVANFAKVLNILNKTARPEFHAVMSSTQLDRLIGCAQKHFPDLVHPIVGIRTHGGRGCESHELYCQRLYEQQVESVAILALSSLRGYVIDWWQCQDQRQEEAGVGGETTLDESSVLTLNESIV